MIRQVLTGAWVLAAGTSSEQQGSAGQLLRIVSYNIAGLRSENDQNPACVPGSLQLVFQALNQDDAPGLAEAPHVYVFQEVGDTHVSRLLALLDAAAPPGITYAAGTYTNHGENQTGGAQAMCYRPDMLEEIAADHIDIPSGGGRETDRWHLRLMGNDTPEMGLYIYSSHLKAGSTPADEQERLAGALAIRANADSLSEGTQIVYAGDFNLYDNSEPAYAALLSTGPGQAVAPLGAGPWDCEADPAVAIKSTQSPRQVNLVCNLFGGGMDDRFDFQLVTGELFDGQGIDLLRSTYRALGNDGLHCNNAINRGDNFYYPDDVRRSNALADALHDASDHLPVVAEYVVCPADLNGDGLVGITDILLLLAAWGSDPVGPPDFDESGVVGIEDLLALLASWGPCPE